MNTKDIVLLAEDLVKSYVDVSQVDFALMKIDVNPRSIAKSNSTVTYYVNVIQYLNARGKVKIWLQEFQKDGLVFAGPWVEELFGDSSNETGSKTEDTKTETEMEEEGSVEDPIEYKKPNSPEADDQDKEPSKSSSNINKLLLLGGLILLSGSLFLAYPIFFPVTSTKQEITYARPKFKALIIANQDYEDASEWKSLKNPINDAMELKDILKNHYGFASKNIFLKKNISAQEISQELSKLQDVCKKEDSVLIFYSGHGNEDGDWVGIDDEVFTSEKIQKSIAQISEVSPHVLLISDSCFSKNLFDQEGRVYSDSSQRIVIRDPTENTPGYYRHRYKYPSVQIITSAAKLAKDQDAKVPDNSPFARVLLDKLKNNRESYFSASELGLHIEKNVSNRLQARQNPDYGRLINSRDYGGEFFFILQKKHLALLVSINEYYKNGAPRLKGANNDARQLKNLLSDRYGFSVIHLSDSEATRQNILDHLEKIQKQSGPEMIVTFVYSGHGSYQKDLSGDEPDGQDETICPYDRVTNGDILDDELYKHFAGILNEGATLFAIFDCCHSGSSFKGRSRSAKPLQKDYKETNFIFADALTKSGKAVFLSAASDSEKALEAEFDYPKKGVYGVFSHSLVSILSEAPYGSTWNDIKHILSTKVKEQSPWQTPTIKGNTSLEIFGLGSHRQSLFQIIAVKNNGKRIIVDGGQISGLESGALIAVYDKNARVYSGTDGRLGIYQISDASIKVATADIHPKFLDKNGDIQGKIPLENQCTAVLLVPGGAFKPHLVSLDEDLPLDIRKTLEEIIETNKNLVFSQFVEHNSDKFHVRLQGQQIVVTGGPYHEVRCSKNDLKFVREWIEKSVQWYRFKRIQNLQSKINYEDIIKVKVYYKEDNSKVASKSSVYFVEKYKTMRVEVENISDRTDICLSVVLLANSAELDVKNSDILEQPLLPHKPIEFEVTIKPFQTFSDNIPISEYLKIFVLENRDYFDPTPFIDSSASRGGNIPWLIGDQLDAKGDLHGKEIDNWDVFEITLHAKN